MALTRLLLLSCAVLCNADVFKTEQSFNPEGWNITHLTKDKSLLSPGYLFLGPLTPHHAWGPQIYDVDGSLIYYGGHMRIQDFTRCDYLGEKENHLCFHQSRFDPDADPRIQKRQQEKKFWGINAPRPVGMKMVFDNTYRQVGSNFTRGMGSGVKKNWPNGHEYNMLPGGNSFLQAVYVPTKWDLRPYTGHRIGYILDGCFQEIDVRTGDIIFQWCFSDHVELWETTLYFATDKQKNATSTKAGAGTELNPWDFVHLNAVDKNEEGDYFVSGRHFDQILKIAGHNNRHGIMSGEIIWRIGGHRNSFQMEGGFKFSKQHAVRHLSTTNEETKLSFFNNAWEGTNEPSAARSAGMIISINNVTKKAKLLREYPHPDGLLGRAMGSMQVLPNGNALVGWGASPQITEFHSDGRVLWHGWYNLPNWKERQKEFGSHEWTYRAFKYTWEGRPHWPPKLLAYSLTCSEDNPSPLRAWVSWNGATGVKRWRFAVAQSSQGPWEPAGTKNRTSFETGLILEGSWQEDTAKFMPWVLAEALGEDGQVMGSAVAKTFVPIPSILEHCNDHGCYNGPLSFDYPESQSCAWLCNRSMLIACLVFALVLVFIECVYFFAGNFCRKAVDLELAGGFRATWRNMQNGQAFKGPHYRDFSVDMANTSKPTPAPGRRKTLESQTEPLGAGKNAVEK